MTAGGGSDQPTLPGQSDSGYTVGGYSYTVAPQQSGFAWTVAGQGRSVSGWCASRADAKGEARAALASLRIDRGRRVRHLRVVQ